MGWMIAHIVYGNKLKSINNIMCMIALLYVLLN